MRQCSSGVQCLGEECFALPRGALRAMKEAVETRFCCSRCCASMVSERRKRCFLCRSLLLGFRDWRRSLLEGPYLAVEQTFLVEVRKKGMDMSEYETSEPAKDRL
jgi:hypothetical protein